MTNVPANTQDRSRGQPLLLEDLFEEQSSMSAVDQFSYWHDQAQFHESTYRSLVPNSMPNSGEQYAFEVDLDACSGCKACVVACHNLNDLEEKETWRKVGLVTSNSAELKIIQHVTTACHHCVQPGCLAGCPVNAYEKDPATGIVKHLDDQCIGCKYCTMMCPYEVPQYSRHLGIVRKCDMCSQRLTKGVAPACVQACPNAAIRISIVRKSDCENRSHEHAVVATAPRSYVTSPTTTYTSAKYESQCLISTSNSETDSTVARTLSLHSVESSTAVLHDGHLPLVAMLVLSQASVGMWIMIACYSITPKSQFLSVVMATVLGFFGVNAALFHLGRPSLAFRVFLGWRTSWLSREAIVLGLFLALSFATCFAVIASRFDLSQAIRDGLLRLAQATTWTTAALGVTGVFCSAMIYIATGRELWSKHRTFWDMGLVTIGLGALGFGTVIEASVKWMIIAWFISLAAILPKFIDLVASQTSKSIHIVSPFVRSGKLMRQELSGYLWGMAALSAVALTMLLARWNAIGFGLTVVFHLVYRWLYFVSVVFRRMPGASS